MYNTRIMISEEKDKHLEFFQSYHKFIENDSKTYYKMELLILKSIEMEHF